MSASPEPELCIKHGFFDTRTHMMHRSSSWPCLHKRPAHIDSRRHIKAEATATAERPTKCSRPSRAERQMHSNRMIDLEEIPLEDETWHVSIRLIVQQKAPQYSPFVDSILAAVTSLPRPCIKYFINLCAGSQAGPNLEKVGLLLIADLKLDGLIFLDWWLLPSACSEEIFTDIGKWLILNIFSPTKPPKYNPAKEYSHVTICHPVSNGNFIDAEIRVLTKFGMEAMCEAVMQRLSDSAVKSMVQSHRWMQWGPLSKEDFEDQRACLMRIARNSSQSLPPLLLDDSRRRRNAVAWQNRFIRGSAALPLVPSWGLSDINNTTGIGACETQMQIQMQSGSVQVPLKIIPKSKDPSLQWGLSPGFILTVSMQVNAQVQSMLCFLPCLFPFVLVASATLTTEVYSFPTDLHTGEVLMKMLALDDSKSSRQMYFDPNTSSFVAELEVLVREDVNRNVENWHALVETHGQPLHCKLQVMCRMRLGDGTDLAPPCCCMVPWVLKLQ
eukprot:TRINITY_DN110551_c0_g1_i1.p1 TRINITY_DN110551_c0_g1~~TRINITY_DN110551_c0_g1_i1.p1  ORF type:complete len:499 (+),score=61.99 TRINITY_DN110551_c0_g1_i1:77-1573(+)